MIDVVEVARGAVAGRLRRSPHLFGAVQRLLGRRDGDNDTVAYAERVYRTFAPLCAGGRTLEIGPGTNLAVSLLLARDGCESYALDIVDPRSADLRPPYDGLARVPRLLGGGGRADGPADAARPVTYVRAGVERLPFADRSLDFIFSNACFEHFRDPAAAVAEIARVLRPGGRTAHQIDLRDHRHMDNPLRFLQYGDRTWAFMNPPGPAYMNRWRLSAYVRAFRSRGFHVEVTVNQRASAEQRAALRRAAPRFQHLDQDDASALGCLLVAEKGCADGCPPATIVSGDTVPVPEIWTRGGME